MCRGIRLWLAAALFAPTATLAVEEGPIHCRGAIYAECHSSGCVVGENHVDMQLRANAREGSKLCIGESCYQGRFTAARNEGRLEGTFRGSDAQKASFWAAIAVAAKRDTATVTWSDGAAVSTVFVTCDNGGQSKASQGLD